MTQGKRDGKNPKFRVLCKRCNSYQYTIVDNRWDEALGVSLGIYITCHKCGNAADSFEEEQ